MQNNEEILTELKFLKKRVEKLINKIEGDSYEKVVYDKLLHSDNEWMIPYILKFGIVESESNLEKLAKRCARMEWIYDTQIKIHVEASVSNWLCCPLPNFATSGIANTRAFNDYCVRSYFSYLMEKNQDFFVYIRDKIKSIASNSRLHRKYGLTSADFQYEFEIDNYVELQRLLLLEFFYLTAHTAH